jgi:hypothetical protein
MFWALVSATVLVKDAINTAGQYGPVQRGCYELMTWRECCNNNCCILVLLLLQLLLLLLRMLLLPLLPAYVSTCPQNDLLTRPT